MHYECVMAMKCLFIEIICSMLDTLFLAPSPKRSWGLAEDLADSSDDDSDLKAYTNSLRRSKPNMDYDDNMML